MGGEGAVLFVRGQGCGGVRGWVGNVLVASLALCAMMWMGAACVLSLVSHFYGCQLLGV
nr:MAG TPA: hypothetical protein [Caudoviricetes sp.]